MALQKTIVQNGVITNYHRILYTQSSINSHNSIAVLSYINEDSRKNESAENRPYTAAITYEKDYEENRCIVERLYSIRKIKIQYIAFIGILCKNTSTVISLFQ